MRKSFKSIYVLMVSVLLLNCGKGEKMTEINNVQPVSESSLKKLTSKKIYFGHQSVGYNIMDGVKDIISKYPEVKVKIIESKNKDDYNNPVFGHSSNGENLDPKSKIDDFEKTINSGLAQKADIAFFKFCYIDFNTATDINKVFSDYSSAMDRLRKKYPRTKFIHITCPLSNNIGINNKLKDIIKSIIGKQTNKEKHFSANIKRNEFNELMKKKYSKDVVFDLAGIESTYPDSKKETFKKNGKVYHALVPEYTYDGGHLNSKGQKIVAGEFLKFLSEISN